MKNLTIQILAFILFFSAGLQAQENAKEKAVHEIDLSDMDNTKQFSFIDPLLKDTKVIGLGEASHGTEEFFAVKGMLVKHLINNLDYQVLAFEMDETVAEAINQFVLHGTGDPKEKLKSYGLYNSQTLYELIDWIRESNLKKKAEDRVQISGFDSEEYWADPFARDSLMAKNFIDKMEDKKYMLWAHTTHLVKSNTWDITNSEIKAMGNILAQKLKDQYYLLIFDTHEGTFNVFEDGALKEYPFEMDKKALAVQDLSKQYPAFFLDANDPAFSKESTYPIAVLFANWQGKPKSMPAKATSDFDGLIYILKTTASKAIE
ncbi:erythromycin esterase family protein [Sphingobacterium hungaricum]